MSDVSQIDSKTRWLFVLAPLFVTILLTGCLSGCLSGGGGGSNAGATGAPVVPPPVVVTNPISAFAAAAVLGNVTVTSANTLAPGAIVVISGTTSYNGTFTVVSATATTFEITAPFVANDATGVWIAGGGVIAGCTTTGTGITLPAMTTVVSRFTGVAPLSVFFDAVGTTAIGTTSLPFHELEYRWNFGDNDSVTWAYGAHVGNGAVTSLGKKNRAMGALAAHVFETPGTYTVTLTVTDGSNTVTNSCIQIAVQDPNVVYAVNTVCIAASGADFTGCPGGATTVTNSNAAAEIATQIAAGKRRILLKGGDTFVSANNILIGIAGPVTIGSFGTGKPTLQTTTQFHTFQISSNAARDWRFIDLIMDGTSRSGFTNFQGARSGSQMTLLRVEMKSANVGLDFSETYLNSTNSGNPCTGGYPYNGSCSDPIWDQIMMADSVVHQCGTGGGAGGNCNFISGVRFALLGNNINDSVNGEHVTRVAWCSHCIINNNNFANPADNKSVLTIRAAAFAGTNTVPAGSYSEYNIVSDNKISETNGLLAILANTTSVTSLLEARLRDIIWERNWLIAGSGTTSSLDLGLGSYQTARNNIFDNSAKLAGGAVMSCNVTADASPDPDHCYFYNNTFYTGAAGAFSYTAIQISGTANDVAKNNLVYSPNITGAKNVLAVVGTVVTSSNNTGDFGTMTTNPNFASAIPANPVDFRITAGSYADGTGGSLPVWSDFFGQPLTLTTTRDIGAAFRP